MSKLLDEKVIEAGENLGSVEAGSKDQEETNDFSDIECSDLRKRAKEVR